MLLKTKLYYILRINTIINHQGIYSKKQKKKEKNKEADDDDDGRQYGEDKTVFIYISNERFIVKRNLPKKKTKNMKEKQRKLYI